MVLCQYHGDFKVFEQVREPFLRVARVEWNIDASRLECSEQTNQHLNRTFRANSDAYFRPDA